MKRTNIVHAKKGFSQRQPICCAEFALCVLKDKTIRTSIIQTAVEAMAIRDLLKTVSLTFMYFLSCM